MIIENLAQICSGILLKDPVVKAVENFTCKSEKVMRGDAFFSLKTTKEEIKEALDNGAYAIIYDGIIQTDDNEVAWIRVDDIKKAMIRLMRFEIERKNINTVFMSVLQFDMLGSFKLQFDANFAPKSIEELFCEFFSYKEKSYLFLSDTYLLEQLSPQFESVKSDAKATILQSYSIFKTSFICGENFFKDYLMPSIFVPHFAALIEFLDEKSLPFKADEVKGHFEPIFVNTDLQPRPFGSTQRALIVESDEELFEMEVKWIQEYVASQHLLILAPHNAKISIKCKRYTSVKSLQTVNISSIRYILMLGDKKQILTVLEEPTNHQGTLF